jgi:hypothetical protein
MLVLGELDLLRLVLAEAVVAEVRRNLAGKPPEAAPLFEEFLRAISVQIKSIVRDPTTVNGRANSPTRTMCRFLLRILAKGRADIENAFWKRVDDQAIVFGGAFTAR